MVTRYVDNDICRVPTVLSPSDEYYAKMNPGGIIQDTSQTSDINMYPSASNVSISGGAHIPAMSTANNHGMYAGASNIIISGGTHTMVNGPHYNINTVPTTSNDRKWIEDLRRHTATGAFHNSGERYDAPKCHPQTRVAVIKEIMDWIKKKNRVEQFLWIYGPVGSGKSSIAQTIAELCEKEGALASDFFFSRNVPGRNTETNLIPSLACQLVTIIPQIGVYLEAAINQDPLLFSRSLPTQLDSLILNPLAQLTSSGYGESPQEKPYPYLIIIDGLDECGQPESHSYILSSLCSAMQKCSAPLIFIIASRPEQAIRDAFNGDLNLHTRRLVLDDKYLPDEDIKIFLDSKFEEIRRKHPLARIMPSEWPSSSDVEYLIQKASGQFIYASTVAKFVGSPRDRPTERLRIVRNLCPPGNNTPFAELDELYKVILGSIEQSKLEQVLLIFAFIIVNAEIDTDHLPLRLLQHQESFLDYQPGDVTLLLSDLHSVVNVANASSMDGRSHYSPVRLYHASMGDFLYDKARSGVFFIDVGVYSAKLAILCIDRMVPILESPVLQDSFDPLFTYASIAFLQLFTTANTDKNLLDKLSSFPIDLFVEWMYARFRIYAFIPSLLEWIYKQDIELHRHYTAHYNNYLRQKLSIWLSRANPRSVAVMTALTLQVKNDNQSTLAFFEGLLHDDPGASLDQNLRRIFFFRQPSDDPTSIDDCLCRLVNFATEPDETGYYWADTSKYVELAIKLLTRFGLSRLELEDPQCTMSDSELDTRALELFSATLDRAPNEPSLAQYLNDTRDRKFPYFGETGREQLDFLVGNYITEYLKTTGIASIEILPVDGAGAQ